MKTKTRSSNWPDGSVCSIGKRYNEEALLGIKRECFKCGYGFRLVNVKIGAEKIFFCSECLSEIKRELLAI
jgi:hypothetical protein